jgi:hypothetical protein
MPPILGTDSFDILDLKHAQESFQSALGAAFGAWALIEERLSYWFEDASGVPR